MYYSMKQQVLIIQQFLQALGISVPSAVIWKLIDTPVGLSIRGISDTLDKLNINNQVYHIPIDYIYELPIPFIAFFPHENEPFQLVTAVSKDGVTLKGDSFMPMHIFKKKWEGIALVAEKTENTPFFNHVRTKDITDWIKHYYLLFLPTIITCLTIPYEYTNYIRITHSILILIGLYISFTLLYREYRDKSFMKNYCLFGRFVDCEDIKLHRRGSLGQIKLCDLSFLYFGSLWLYTLFSKENYWSWVLALLSIACVFTLYSVIIQFFIERKLCLFCMTINLIIWADTTLLLSQQNCITFTNTLTLTISISLTYIIWWTFRRNMKYGKIIEQQKHRLQYIYRKDLLDFLLSQEKPMEELSEYYGECSGKTDIDTTISIFTHPNCNVCKRMLPLLPSLTAKARIRIFSLQQPAVIQYCLVNNITQTPTVIINNRKLPELYSIEDLQYIL